MKERLQRILPFVAYGVFYLVVFFLACYFTFPYGKLKDRLIAEFAAEQKAKATTQRLEIDELEPYWFTGVRARGVRLTILPAAKPIDTGDEPPTVIELEELRARVSIFARLLGKTKVSFYARAFGGEIDGMFYDAAAERHLDFELSDLSVARVTPLVSLVGLPLYGVMKGKVDLTFPDKRASKADGSVNLSIVDLAAGDGKAKIKGTLALPKMDAGELALEAEAKEGVVKVNKLSATGKDLELVADGTFKLKDQPTESQADVYLRFKFTDAYKGKNDITKGLFGAPGSTAPALFELADAKIRQSKRSDGFYGWHMIGLLSNIRFEPYAGNPPTQKPGGAVKGFAK